MKKLSLSLTALCAAALLSACGSMTPSASTTAPMAAPKTVMVGGAEMFPSKDIIDNAVNSKDHTTLVAAVKAAGLVDTLKSAGPFTVFAPVNSAFAALPAGTVDNLLKPESKAALTKVLTYHVVPGRVNAADLVKQINAGGGKAMLKTASGGMLTASLSGSNSAHLRKIAHAHNPMPKTIARIEAAIAGRICDPAGKAPPTVARDPCFNCGTRADIGCRHQGARL